MPIALRWSRCLLILSLASAAGCAEEAPVDVYVAGYDWGWPSNYGHSVQIAKVWKNGVGQALADVPSLATSVAVAGGVVHVAGCVKDPKLGYYTVATTWRDGVLQVLTDGTWPACAQAVAADGDDVYAVGSYLNRPVLWKNGVAQELPHMAEGLGSARAVTVAGGSVYVAGSATAKVEEFPGVTRYYTAAKLWKDGVEIELPSGTAGAGARGVAVEGDDVYVAGYMATTCTAPCQAPFIATVWKNGVPIRLTDGKHGAAIQSVVVSGGLMYAAGSQSNGTVDVPTVWVDGFAHPLGDGSQGGRAEGIALAGGDAYVAGLDARGLLYWKNGTPERPGDFGYSDGEAFGIAVVPR